MEDQNEFEKLLGQAAIAIWADLPRDSQELLFEAAVSSDADARGRLAIFLHDHHPETTHLDIGGPAQRSSNVSSKD
jgi:hypothetical protein